jgi:hypothetical protein
LLQFYGALSARSRGLSLASVSYLVSEEEDRVPSFRKNRQILEKGGTRGKTGCD